MTLNGPQAERNLLLVVCGRVVIHQVGRTVCVRGGGVFAVATKCFSTLPLSTILLVRIPVLWKAASVPLHGGLSSRTGIWIPSEGSPSGWLVSVCPQQQLPEHRLWGPAGSHVSSPIVRLSLWVWGLPQHLSYEHFLLAEVGLSPFLLLKTQET